MKKLYYIAVLIVFIICKEQIVVNGVTALDLWSSKLFPLLFPTFILADFLLSSDIPNFITAKLGGLYEKIFRVNRYGLFVFIVSMIAGTPTNAKMLYELNKNNVISDNDVTKILGHSILFNPFLIVSYGGIKLLIVFWISNILTGVLMRGFNSDVINNTYTYFKFRFNLNDSINKNVTILLNILGTITFFSCLIGVIPFSNIYVRYFFISFLEVTNAISFCSNFLNNNLMLLALALSVGSFSIFIQIKSILKDTSINFKYILISRLICACICESLIKCLAT